MAPYLPFLFFSQPLDNLFLTVKRSLTGISRPYPHPQFNILWPNILEKNVVI